MTQIAFVSSFTGIPARSYRAQFSVCIPSPHRALTSPPSRRRVQMTQDSKRSGNTAPTVRHNSSSKSRRVIGIVGKSATKKQTAETVQSSKGGIFGMKASAYWESIGVLPLAFAGFGVVALAIKMLKVKGGEMRSGPSGINKVTIPKSAITTVEEEAELHVFKCGGCGFEMYPARGRESKFFPDSFKCPLCGTPKSDFWDLNDPDDPRNQEPDEDGEEEDGEEEDEEDEEMFGEDSVENEEKLVNPEEPSAEIGGAGTSAKDRAGTDSST